MAILWDAPPPPRKGLDASIRLLCVRSGDGVLVAILGPLVGLKTHWIDEKTVACQGAEGCPYHDKPQTWKGYVAVLQIFDKGAGKLARAPAPSVLTCSEEIGWTMKSTLRGDVYFVARLGKKNNAPMRAEKRDLAIPGQLPASFDVKPYVARAMGICLG